MMRGILSLALVLLAGASSHHKCELNAGDAVEHGMNAVLDIWAATKRCHGPDGMAVKCERDVASSIQELTAFGGAVAEMVGSCAGVKMENADCAEAANSLVSATAGLAAASGAIANDCAHIVPEHLNEDVNEEETLLGKCTADAGDSMNSLFHSTSALQHVQKKCSDSKKNGKCTVEALDVVSVLSSFGAYIAAAYNDCSAYDAKRTHSKGADTSAAACTADVLAGIADLSALANIGLKMNKACASSSSRLYLNTNVEATTAAGSLSNMALAAFLPIAMVLSFVAGRRFGKADQSSRSIEGLELLESQEE